MAIKHGTLPATSHMKTCDTTIFPMKSAKTGAARQALSALSYRATLPANAEARRRIVSLARSLQMHPLPQAKARAGNWDFVGHGELPIFMIDCRLWLIMVIIQPFVYRGFVYNPMITLW